MCTRSASAQRRLSGSYSILRISSANCGGCVGSGAIFGVDMDYLTNGGIIPWKKIHEIPRPTQICSRTNKVRIRQPVCQFPLPTACGSWRQPNAEECHNKEQAAEHVCLAHRHPSPSPSVPGAMEPMINTPGRWQRIPERISGSDSRFLLLLQVQIPFLRSNLADHT